MTGTFSAGRNLDPGFLLDPISLCPRARWAALSVGSPRRAWTRQKNSDLGTLAPRRACQMTPLLLPVVRDSLDAQIAIEGQMQMPRGSSATATNSTRNITNDILDWAAALVAKLPTAQPHTTWKRG